MDHFIQTVKKLSLICVLSTKITESSVVSGSIFSDIRTSLYSRMLELTKRHWTSLNLIRFLPKDISPHVFLDWLDKQLVTYSNKDVFMHPSYLHTTSNNIFKYNVEPTSTDNAFLYYNLSPIKIIWLLQRLNLNTVYFPCRYSLYIEDDIDNIIIEVNKKYEPNT